jgi:hypothetical protein
VALAGPAAQAHHAAAVQFDVEKVLTFDAVIEKVEWINPHSYAQVVRTNPQGVKEKWAIEMAGTNAMRRGGVTNKDMFKVGESYKFEVNPARNGATSGLISSVTFPDGRIFRLGAYAQR